MLQSGVFVGQPLPVPCMVMLADHILEEDVLKVVRVQRRQQKRDAIEVQS